MGADRRPNDRSRAQAVRLASLPVAQRRLITALLEAAKAAAIGRAVGADTKMIAPAGSELLHRRERLR